MNRALEHCGIVGAQHQACPWHMMSAGCGVSGADASLLVHLLTYLLADYTAKLVSFEVATVTAFTG